jgi:hypothetical protein
MINQLIVDLGIMTLAVATKAHSVCEAAVENTLTVDAVLDLQRDIDITELLREALVKEVRISTDPKELYEALRMIDLTAQNMQTVMNFMAVLEDGIKQAAS